MAVERTLSIIKPDATRRSLTGKINARFEAAQQEQERQAQNLLQTDLPIVVDMTP